ncbi:hypothetical protein [Kribbella catacumbae]|uniref:hypothetical protein n=1 Tax=Kribbella catacumbae TaxID=460086 RepID=UPI00037F360A|nr:hypothetical protein [Kribbella catacumbae]
MSTPAQGDLAVARAREALGTAFGVVAPAGVRLRDGSFRLDAQEVLPAQVVNTLDERLSRRAADRASDERLLAESVALVGAEVARNRGLDPADGATAALDRLLHVPGLQQAHRVEADAMLRSVLESAAPRSEAAAARLATLPDESRTARPTHLVSTARQIRRDAHLLANQAAPSSTSPGTALPVGAPQPRTGRHRSQVGARHRRVNNARTATPQVRGSGLVTGIGGRPVLDPDLNETTALAALQQLDRAELGGTITSKPTINPQAQLAVIETAASNAPQHVRVEILPTSRGTAAEGQLHSGTENDPHVVRFSPRLADDQLAQVWVHQLNQVSQQLDAANAGRPTGIRGRLRSLLGHEKRDRSLNADYASYQFLTSSWHRARAQTAAYGRPTGPQSVAELERDVEALATSIQKKGGTAPALPWAADAIHVPGAAAAGTAAAIAVRTEAAEVAPYTPPALRLQVVDEVADLQSEVQGLERLAAAKSVSSAAALKQAEELSLKADAELSFKDKGAPERARVLEVEASGATRKAHRHAEISEGYRKAAVAAGQALAGQQDLLTELDAVIADPNRPQTAIATLARDAAEKTDAYQVATDQALPVKDVLNTGVPAGGPLETPVAQIDQVLAARGISAQLADSTGPLPLPEAAYRRLLSPAGMEFTVGGSPNSDVTKLAQVRLKLRPHDVRENLDLDYDLAEQMSGTIGDGGQSVSTTAAHSTNFNFGLDLQPLMAMAPPGGTVHSLSQVAGLRVDASSGRAQSESSGSSSHDKQGAVDDNRGESLQVGWNGTWEIEVRASATDPWSPAETFDAGPQLTWVSAAYTVKPAAETVTLADLGRADEIDPAFPRHTVTDIDGMTSIRDRLVAGGRERFGAIDKVAYGQINGLLTEDMSRLLRQTSKPGGYGRQIVSAGEAQYHMQLEVEPIWSTAKLSGESSPDLWQEEVEVDFAGVNASQSFSTSASASVGVAYPGKAVDGQPVPGYMPSPTALSDIGSTSMDVSPRGSAGRNVSRQGGLNVSATSITPVVHRSQGPTQGVVVGLGIRATLRKLNDPDAQPVVVTDFCDARLRVPENDLLRAGARVDAKAVLRNPDKTVRLDQYDRALLRGDPEPPTGVQTLPATIGPEEEQMRGSGQALVQNLTGDRAALNRTLRDLSGKGLVPPLDEAGHRLRKGLGILQPDFGKLPSDRRQRAGQLINYDRVIQHIAAERLEAGYNQAAQSGIPMVLVDQQTGHAPKLRTFRIAIRQDFGDVTGEGTSTTDNVVRLGIASDASGRSGGRSKGAPLSAGAGVSNGPAEGVRGLAGRLGFKLSRNAIGRSFNWSAGRRVNRVSLTESTGPVDKLRTGHRIVVTEVTPNGDSAPIANEKGSAQILVDSALSRAAAPVHAAQRKAPSAVAVKQSMPVHVDAGNPVDRITSAVDAIELGSNTYLELHSMLGPDSLVAHKEWMNGEYRLPMTIVPPAGNPIDAIQQGALLPQRFSVVVRGEAVDRTFVATTEQNTGDINLTMKDTSFTAGRSASGGGGLDGGGGPVEADGSSLSAGGTLGRTGGRSQSTTNSQTAGEEGLLINVGTHHQFVDRYKMVADVVDASGTVVQSVPLQDAKVQTTTPERRTLRMYGRRELDLPLEVVSDAAERYLNGQLKISPRDASAFIRRYKQEAGAATGLAAEHTEERLTEKVIAHAKTAESTAPTAAQRFDETLTTVDQEAAQQRAMALPRQYNNGLASAQIEDISPIGRPGEQVDHLTPALRQVEQLAPGLLASDPMLRSALATDLGTDGWHGHLGDMFGVRGFVAEIEVPIPGQPNPDLIVIRDTARYAGPVMVDGTPDLGEVSAIGLKQNYSYQGQGESVTHSTTYSAGVELKGAGDTTASAGVGVNRTRVVSARRGTTNTTLDRTGHFELAEVQREVVFDIQVSRVHNAGAAAVAGARWRLNQTLPAGQTTHATPEQVRGQMTLMVPRKLLTPLPANAAAQNAPGTEVEEPQPDHRQFQMPAGVTAEAMLPYGEKDDPQVDQLHQQIRAYLAGHKDMGDAAMREYDVALEGQLSPTALGANIKHLTSSRGLELTPMAGRGNGNTAFVVVIKARPVGWDLKEVLDGQQDGSVSRSEESNGVSTTGNQLAPVTGSGGASGGIVNIGASIGENVKVQTSDSHATRMETSAFSNGPLAVVETPMVYNVTVHEIANTGRGLPKTKHSEQLPETAKAVYSLKMLTHKYLDGLRQLETGTTADPLLAAAPAELGKPERATEYGKDDKGNDVHQPYRPMLKALRQAVASKQTVTLAMQEASGVERTYQAFPNGSLTEVGDGSGYAEAFATLHPQIALMCEGRIDLRELYNTTARSESFNGKVAEELGRSGVPISMLKGLDHSTTARQLATKPDQSARRQVGGAAGRTITASGHGPSIAGS